MPGTGDFAQNLSGTHRPFAGNLVGMLLKPTQCLRLCAHSLVVSGFLDGGKEVLSMHQVLLYLLRSSKPLVPEEEIADMLQWEELEWQKYAEECKGMIVTNPGMVRGLDVDPMATV